MEEPNIRPSYPKFGSGKIVNTGHLKMTRQGIIWRLFFLSKMLYMLFAVFVFSKYTILGDHFSYLESSQPFSTSIFFSSTTFLNFIGNVFGTITGRTFLANLPFIFLAFYGVYYPLSRVELPNGRLVIVLLILSFPSFGIWTSILGKEVFCVFALGVILGYFIDLLNGNIRVINLKEIVGVYLLFLFKPQYFIAIAHVWVLVFLRTKKKVATKDYIFFAFILMLVLDISLLYHFRDIIDELSFSMYAHFNPSGAGSTREISVFENQYDIFFQAHYGMIVAFIGPSFDELVDKPVFIPFFIEGVALLALLTFLNWREYANVLVKGKINVLFFTIVFFTLFWFLFVHYPFGVFNPGSATRYRSNFIHFLVIFVFYFRYRIKWCPFIDHQIVRARTVTGLS